MPNDKPDIVAFPSLMHAHSPSALTEINTHLTTMASADELDVDKLSEMAHHRALTVEGLLTELPEEQRQAFARAELSINRQLEAYFLVLQQSVKKEILGVTKGKNAVSKYIG